MSGRAKLVAAILIASALAEVLMAMALAPARITPPAPIVRPPSRAPDHAALDRCRTITMPDSACDAAWAAERQRFFREPKP